MHTASIPPDSENIVLNTNDSLPKKTAASYIAAGCIIGFVVANWIPLLTNRTAEAAGGNAALSVLDSASARDVVLSYTFETSPNSTAGDDSLPVDSIEFQPNYVLVTAKNGNTSLFAVNRLRSFSYRPATSE